MADYGFGYNPSTGRTGIGYNVGGWQTSTTVSVIPEREKERVRAGDKYKRSKGWDESSSKGKEAVDDVTSAAAKAKAAQAEAARKKAEAKDRAAQEKAEAKEQAEQEKADAAYLERFAKGKPLLTAAGLNRLAEHLSDPRFVRSTGSFRGEAAVAKRVGGWLQEGWSIAGVEEQQRSRPGKGKLGGLFKENYTVMVIKLASPDGTRTVAQDAAEKRK